MYGIDGNMTALEWAKLVGFEALTVTDQQRLVEGGHFTTEGHEIFTPAEGAALDQQRAKGGSQPQFSFTM